jgi:hypothetical protein
MMTTTIDQSVTTRFEDLPAIRHHGQVLTFPHAGGKLVLRESESVAMIAHPLRSHSTIGRRVATSALCVARAASADRPLRGVEITSA